MTGLLDNLYLAFPEILLLITACVALLGDLFVKRRLPAFAFSVSCIGLLLAIVMSFLCLGQPTRLLFNGLFISDDMAQLMKIFIEITVLLSFIYSKQSLHEQKMPSGDYMVLGLFSTLGMMTVVSAHSLLTLYLGLELLSLPLYALAAIKRTQGDGSEAAMKYIVMGAISAGLLLYGFSLLYGATGQLDLQKIAVSIADHKAEELGLLSFALVFILAGVGFKLAAVPFHMWAPDVYTGAPTPVTLLISSAPKIAAMALLLRLVLFSFEGIQALWQPLLLIMALLSTCFGNLLAIVQQNIKRLFAYSAISHMGYALFGVLAATPEGYAAALYYVLVYALMSAAAFGLLAIISRQGIEITAIDDLKGLNKRNPWLAFMMLLTLLSMAGIPPLVGFFTKLAVLKALVNANMLWVAALGLVFAVFGAFYYLKLVKIMYFDEAQESTPVTISPMILTIFSVNCGAFLYLGLFPSGLITACMNAF